MERKSCGDSSRDGVIQTDFGLRSIDEYNNIARFEHSHTEAPHHRYHHITHKFTGGALVGILTRHELSLQCFSTMVIDEAHHVTGAHVFNTLLDFARELPSAHRPRLLGLTASPISASNKHAAEERLDKLRRYFGGAGVYRPRVTPTRRTTEWVPVQTTPEQTAAIRQLADCVGNGVKAVRTLGHCTMLFEGQDEERVQARKFLSTPGALGRFRGKLNCAEDELEAHKRCAGDTADQALDHVESLHLVCSAFELCMLVGPGDALSFLNQASKNRPVWLRVPIGPTATMSPHFQELKARLLREPATSRVLVFVNTRVATRRLRDALCADTRLGKAFKPKCVVGQNGYDGMDWRAQNDTLADFAAGKVRLLVCTSVLEEGLDVPACNLVIRFQGIGA